MRLKKDSKQKNPTKKSINKPTALPYWCSEEGFPRPNAVKPSRHSLQGPSLPTKHLRTVKHPNNMFINVDLHFHCFSLTPSFLALSTVDNENSLIFAFSTTFCFPEDFTLHLFSLLLD